MAPPEHTERTIQVIRVRALLAVITQDEEERGVLSRTGTRAGMGDGVRALLAVITRDEEERRVLSRTGTRVGMEDVVGHGALHMVLDRLVVV